MNSKFNNLYKLIMQYKYNNIIAPPIKIQDAFPRYDGQQMQALDKDTHQPLYYLAYRQFPDIPTPIYWQVLQPKFTGFDTITGEKFYSKSDNPEEVKYDIKQEPQCIFYCNLIRPGFAAHTTENSYEKTRCYYITSNTYLNAYKYGDAELAEKLQGIGLKRGIPFYYLEPKYDNLQPWQQQLDNAFNNKVIK